MKRFGIIAALLLVVLAGNAFAQSTPVQIVADLDSASATGISVEGLVADSSGNLYTSDLASRKFYRIAAASGKVDVLGTLPGTSLGMAFDGKGDLYLAAASGSIYRLPASLLAAGSFTATDVLTFATGVRGANGIAFDTASNLFVSGGQTGSIYKVATDGSVVTFTSGLTSTRSDQQISTNGLAFSPLDGKLYSANTGSGTIDRFALNADGTAGAREQFAASNLLLGADGITFAANGDLYVCANERNAIVRVTPDGKATDIASNDNKGPLEFPASPSFVGNALYATNFDIAKGENAPNSPGIGASIARIEVNTTGAPLPFKGRVQVQPPVGSPVVSPTAAIDTTPVQPAVTATVTVTGPATLPASPEATAAIGSTPQVQPATTATSAMMASPTAAMMAETPSPTASQPSGLPRTGDSDMATIFALLIFALAAVGVGIALRTHKA